MARLTANGSVAPAQYERRIAVMVKGARGPSLRRVTGMTLFAMATLVFVVGSVTSHAGGTELVFKNVCLVTVLATHGTVLSKERKFRLPVMVKGGFRPLRRRMTTFTPLAVAPSVGVV